MRSEFALDDGFLGFTHQTLQRFLYPCGTARVVSGESLSGMETALLDYFRKNAGRTISREELAEQVWKQRHFYGSRTIDQTVSKLRKKLRNDARILSVWSAGYRFENTAKPSPRPMTPVPVRR
jgi:DNA-binding response OmpR family regulator